MTEADVIAHWRRGARDALEVAQAAHDRGKHALALFNVHLAVEKALKARLMQETRADPPLTHDLLQLASGLGRRWTADERRLLGSLTQYAVAARYDDPGWAEREATAEKAAAWIGQATHLLSSLSA